MNGPHTEQHPPDRNSGSLIPALPTFPVTRIRGLASRFTGLIPPERRAGIVIAQKIDGAAAEIAQEATRILGSTIPAEGGRQFLSRAEFDECLDFLARLSDHDDWRFLLEAERG